MHIFYNLDIDDDEVLLSEEESKHALRVLRLKLGDEVQLVDGKGTLATARIKDNHVKKCVLEMVSRVSLPSPRPYKLHIAIAPTKNAERTEWFIEKAVEVGVDRISFMACKNSERVKVNMERCEKVAISAMKQSKQLWLPEIDDLVSINTLLEKPHEGIRLIAWCETATTETLTHYLSAKGDLTILIGPEGDFTKAEVDLALKQGFLPVSFGQSRLRTETAALYACMAVHVLRTGQGKS